jgi:cell division protein FtsZ
MALMGVGEHEGDNAAYEAIKAAIESPLLDNMSINGAMGVLVHFSMHPDFPIMDIYDAMNVVNESADDEADIIFGTSTDSELAGNYVKITIVATGFEKEKKIEPITGNNSEFVSETPAPPRAKVRPRLVVGGELDSDYLDIPAYLRQQQD